MAGGIRGYFGSRADGATELNPRSYNPIPNRDDYTRLGIGFGVKFDEYIRKAADAHAEPGLPLEFWMSDD